jgi:hypothetical protein
VVQLDNGQTIECDFSTLAPQTANLPSDQLSSPASADPFDSMPYILKRNSKITIDHQGAFHKGYLDHTFEGGFIFAYKRAPNLNSHFGPFPYRISTANGTPWWPKM